MRASENAIIFSCYAWLFDEHRGCRSLKYSVNLCLRKRSVDKMNIGLNLSGRLLQFVLQLILLRLITTLLSKEDAAVLFVVLLISGAASLFLISPLGQYFNRHLIEFEKQRIVSLQLISFLAYAIFITPLVFFFAVAYFEIQEEMLVDRYVYIACTCYFFAITLNQVSIGSLNILGRSKEFVFYSLLTQGLILAQISLLSMVGLSYIKWLFCLIVSNVIVGCCALYSLLDGSQKDLYFKDRRDHWLLNIPVEFHKAWGFGRHLLIALVCIWIFQVGFRFELLPLLGVEQFALFSMGYSLAAVIFSGCEQIINSYCLPIYYRRVDSESASGAWEWLAQICLPTYIISLIVAFSFSEIFVFIFLDKSYVEAGYYMRIGAVFEFLRVIYNLVSLHSHGLKNPKLLIKPALIGALIFVVGQPLIMAFPNAHTLFGLVIIAGCSSLASLGYIYVSRTEKVDFVSSSLYKLIPFVALAFLIQEFLPATPTIFEAFIILMMAAVASLLYWIYLVKTIIIEIVNLENIKNA
jgi:O-antigen/teichoic acid export membrane protein